MKNIIFLVISFFILFSLTYTSQKPPKQQMKIVNLGIESQEENQSRYITTNTLNPWCAPDSLTINATKEGYGNFYIQVNIDWQGEALLTGQVIRN